MGPFQVGPPFDELVTTVIQSGSTEVWSRRTLTESPEFWCAGATNVYCLDVYLRLKASKSQQVRCDLASECARVPLHWYVVKWKHIQLFTCWFRQVLFFVFADAHLMDPARRKQTFAAALLYFLLPKASIPRYHNIQSSSTFFLAPAAAKGWHSRRSPWWICSCETLQRSSQVTPDSQHSTVTWIRRPVSFSLPHPEVTNWQLPLV